MGKKEKKQQNKFEQNIEIHLQLGKLNLKKERKKNK